MANPWSTTALQVSLDPLYRLVKKIDVNHGTNQSRRSDPYRSPFMMKLRAADRLIEKDRERKFFERAVDTHPVILQSRQLFDQLTDLYERLASQLELINRPELLKEMIVFDRPFFVWEEISQENKEKLINSIRSGTRAIVTLLTNRSEEMSSGPLEECKYHLLNVIQDMDIFNEQIDFDDYDLPQLYEFLMECCHAMDLIKKTSPKLRPAIFPIPVSLSTPLSAVTTNGTSSVSPSQEIYMEADETSSIKSHRSLCSSNNTPSFDLTV